MIVFKSASVVVFAIVLLTVALFASIVTLPSVIVRTTVIDADCKGTGKIVNVTLCVDPTIPLLISFISASTLINSSTGTS